MGPAVSSTVPTVSVVIPVKDDAPLLAVCLRALMPQLNAGDEVIVVDNGCVDDSAAVAQRAGARVVVEQRPGIPAASAAGYDAALGEIIGRMDADSVPAPNWLDSVREAFRADTSLAAVTGGAHFIDGPRMLRLPGVLLYLGSYFLLVGGALGHVPLFGSNCAFRRSEWLRVRDSVHRADAELHDDIDLSFHIGPLGRIRFLRGLRMGISSRPLYESRRAAARRMRRAFRTLGIHWPEQRPSVRYAARMTAAGIIRPPARLRSHRN